MNLNRCYNLYNSTDLKDFYCNHIRKKYNFIEYDKIKENISLLYQYNLSEEWVNIIPLIIGHYLVFPNKLHIGKKLLKQVPFIFVNNLAENLQFFDVIDIKNYVKRLNTQCIDRLNVLYEIEIISRFKKNGYTIVNEPKIDTIGKSGNNKKSDVLINFKNSEIFLEKSTIPFIFKGINLDPNHQFGNLVTEIRESIRIANTIPADIEIDATLIGSYNNILKRNWKKNFLNYLNFIKNEGIIHGKEYTYGGINFVFKNSSNELYFLLSYDISTDFLKRFKKKVNVELDQLPKDKSGVIVLVISEFDQKVLEYAKGILNDRIISIILFIEEDIRFNKMVLTKENLDDEIIKLLNENIRISSIY